MNTQVKLLRVLESSEVMRVGGTDSFKVDVRVIAATNKNLEQAVQQDEFRRDLYYRLKAITINIPPLRRRLGDISILVEKIASAYTEKNNIPFKGFAPDALDALMGYNWPGNVRELRNFVETAIILNKGEIIRSAYVLSALKLDQGTRVSENLPVPFGKTPDQAERELIYRTLISLKLDMTEVKQMLQMCMGKGQSNSGAAREDRSAATVQNDNEVRPTTMTGMERRLIKETLEKYAGGRRKTARALQISERTLYRKINEYGL